MGSARPGRSKALPLSPSRFSATCGSTVARETVRVRQAVAQGRSRARQDAATKKWPAGLRPPDCTRHGQYCPQRHGGGPRGGGREVAGPGKRALIAVPETLWTLIERHEEWQQAERVYAGTEWHDGGWMFTGTDRPADRPAPRHGGLESPPVGLPDSATLRFARCPPHGSNRPADPRSNRPASSWTSWAGRSKTC